jgi:cell division protease FtsH
MPAEKAYSEKIAAEIDEEVKQILEQAQATARNIIGEKSAIVETIAGRLLEKEVIDRDEFLLLANGVATEHEREEPRKTTQA